MEIDPIYWILLPKIIVHFQYGHNFLRKHAYASRIDTQKSHLPTRKSRSTANFRAERRKKFCSPALHELDLSCLEHFALKEETKKFLQLSFDEIKRPDVVSRTFSRERREILPKKVTESKEWMERCVGEKGPSFPENGPTFMTNSFCLLRSCESETNSQNSLQVRCRHFEWLSKSLSG